MLVIPASIQNRFSELNLSNIFAKGILAKNEVERQNLNYESFANNEVQKKRHTRYFFLSNNTYKPSQSFR